ncbi:PREDICTED: eukaryotic translation initiation factor 5B-like [Nicotiana attenuata]|uniref:DC1 domain-containing protein n=1 Tax=Nicotiana attenuata TaxID=49451 RepID=A0A1J6JQ32_NICAT|nr:PREDICTED: eukaryotic translation initiation factor 5B-like [Nicotiana attenuata]OIT19890.1 hypothetical protein A4A49_39761 [Nicotiana attenuata]
MKFQDNQHFSHHHILKSLVLNEGDKLHCQACEQLIFEPFHGCISCNFYLHENCLNAPRSLVHPSHPSHPLTLLPTPTYSSRSFTCNACGSEGRLCSLSCAHCNFDLHLKCALLPQTVLLDQHHHELKLIFGSPFDDEDENTIFVCDLCHGKTDQNYWLYYCADCDFGTHIECGISKYVNKPKENPVIKKAINEPVISTPTRSPIRKTEKKSTKNPRKNPKMKPDSPDEKPEKNGGEGEENPVVMKLKEKTIKKAINEPAISAPMKSPVRKTKKISANSPRENPNMRPVAESLDEEPAEASTDKPEENEGEENAEFMKPEEEPIKKAVNIDPVISAPIKGSSVRTTKKKSAKNPRENPKMKSVSESPPDENSSVKTKENEEGEGEGEEEESELSYYEAQRRLKEQHMKHMLMMQALDNAASYVGPSRGYNYYY